jgi:hypothetical protein
MAQRFEGYDYDQTGLGYPGWPGSLFADRLMHEITSGQSANPTETNLAKREHTAEIVGGAHWLKLVDGASVSG